MISRLRKHVGSAGLIVAIVALVMALSGGAYAAGTFGGGNGHATASGQHHKKKKKEESLNKKQKKEATNIAKKYAGKQGPQGPAGSQGSAGANGKDGTNGGNGTNGTNGKDGTNGKSVVVGSFTGEEEELGKVHGGEEPCDLHGGNEIEVEGSGAVHYACNGKEGSPWVAGTAPSGAVLQGTWAVHTTAAAANEKIPVPLSTGVPVMPPSLAVGYAVDYIASPPEASDPNGCTGTADAPTPPTNTSVVCVYAKSASNLSAPEGLDATKLGKSGGGMTPLFKAPATGVVSAYGSWVLVSN